MAFNNKAFLNISITLKLYSALKIYSVKLNLSTMTTRRRSYSQNCALAHAVDLLGERWTLLIIRDLLVRPRRYNELLKSLRGIGTNLLASRLKTMEQDELITCSTTPAGHNTYHLTDLGKSLETAVLELIRWGFRLGPRGNPKNHHQDDWDLLALKAAFVPDSSRHMDITVGFTQPEFSWVSLVGPTLKFGFDPGVDCDVVVDGSVQQFSKAPNKIKIQGSKRKLAQFGKAFQTQ